MDSAVGGVRRVFARITGTNAHLLQGKKQKQKEDEKNETGKQTSWRKAERLQN
jgi:hypothetical protein